MVELQNIVFVSIFLLKHYIRANPTEEYFSLENFSLNPNHVGISIETEIRSWLGKSGAETEAERASLVQKLLSRIHPKFQTVHFNNPDYSKQMDFKDRQIFLEFVAREVAKFNKIISPKKPFHLTICFGVSHANEELNPHPSFSQALSILQVANEVFPGTVNILMLDAAHLELNLKDVLNELKLAKERVPSSVKLFLGFLDFSDICLSSSSEIEQIVNLLDAVILVPYVPKSFKGKAVSSNIAFKKSIDSLERCHFHLKRINSKSVKFHLAARHDPNVETFDSWAYFWWLMNSYGEQNNCTVYICDKFDNFVDMYLDDEWNANMTISVDTSYRYVKKDHNRPKTENEISIKWIGIGIALVIVVVGILSLAVYSLCRKNKFLLNLVRSSGLTIEDIRKFKLGSGKPCQITGVPLWDSSFYDENLEMARESFFVDTTVILGSGEFGCVFRGHLKTNENNSQIIAVKTVNENSRHATALKGLLSEIKVMSHLGKHDNLVSILGAYTAELEKGVIFVAIEFCSKGSLEKYLRRIQNDNDTGYLILVEKNSDTSGNNGDPEGGLPLENVLMRLSQEICSGMQYLSSKNVVHADLATRNILLTCELKVKISDFGLSRKLYNYSNYVKKQQEPLPWKWMAPESLQSLEFSEKSDVWAFGVTLWEIFTLGNNPYPGLSWHINFVQELGQGLRLEQPALCSDNLYNLILSCWKFRAENRPTFALLQNQLTSYSSLPQEKSSEC